MEWCVAVCGEREIGEMEWGRGYRARSRGCEKRWRGREEDRRRAKDLGIVIGRSGLLDAYSTGIV